MADQGIPHPAVGAEARPAPGELNRIRFARINHANACMVGELMELRHPKVDEILNKFGIAIIPGPRVAIEYPNGYPQILETELTQAKIAEALDQVKPNV